MVDMNNVLISNVNGVKVSREVLLNIIPEDVHKLIPINKANLLVKISIKDLKSLGLNFEDYKIICDVYKKNNDYYLKICYN